MKGSKVYYHRDKSLTGTVVGVTRPLEEDKYSHWYSRGRWHKRKRASAGKRLVMVQWDRPCNLYKWISETSVVVINPVVETKEKVKEPTTTKEKEMERFIIAGTGSRELAKDNKEWQKVLRYLMDLLYGAYEKHGDKLLIVSGMAEGFDEALAQAAFMTEIPLLAAIPNKGYSKYYWEKNSLTGNNRMEEFQEFAKYAHRTGGVHYVCNGIYGPDGRHSNFHRNEWMVDQADIVWVYNPTTRGTAQCYAYCKKVGKRTFIINPNKGE